MKKKGLVIFIFLSILILNGCSLDGWTALGVFDSAVSKATGDDNSGPTPIPTKSSEIIEQENKIAELFEQDYLGYDLAYDPKYTSGYDRYYQLCLVDFDRQIETNITREPESTYIVIKTKNIIGTMDTDWADAYYINDKTLYKSAVYKRIIESNGEQVIEFFQKYNTFGEKEDRIIETNEIRNLEEGVAKLKELMEMDCRNTEDMYYDLFPRE